MRQRTLVHAVIVAVRPRYTNLNLPTRTGLIAKYVKEYEADGFIVHSIKSCNSFSAGQLLILREIERRTGGVRKSSDFW